MSLFSIHDISNAMTSAMMVEKNLKMIASKINTYNTVETQDVFNTVILEKEIASTLATIEGVNNKFFSKLICKTLIKIGE